MVELLFPQCFYLSQTNFFSIFSNNLSLFRSLFLLLKKNYFCLSFYMVYFSFYQTIFPKLYISLFFSQVFYVSPFNSHDCLYLLFLSFLLSRFLKMVLFSFINRLLLHFFLKQFIFIFQTFLLLF